MFLHHFNTDPKSRKQIVILYFVIFRQFLLPYQGVYIIFKKYIFAPPPFFQNDIFCPKYSENSSFPPFFHLLPHYIRLFS